jgi:hypothetical protein
VLLVMSFEWVAVASAIKYIHISGENKVKEK